MSSPTWIDVCFEDIERPMERRIRELKTRLAKVAPALHVHDVEATGSCFFLCGNLARQDLRLSARTYDEEQLRAAADADRLDVVALMLEKLAVPMADGETLEEKLNLAALESVPGTSESGVCFADCDLLASSVCGRCRGDS